MSESAIKGPQAASDDTGRRVLVIGATGGIGAALCRRMASRGWSIFMAARHEDSLRALEGSLRESISRDAGAASIHWTALDATQPGAIESAADQALTQLGRIDAIVNLVGSILLKPAHQTTDAELDLTLRLNLFTAFACVRAAARTMRTSGGSVVLMGTAAARAGLPNHEAIAAAKGAVAGLALSAAATYAPQNIRVNVVAPGLVDTPMASGITASEVALQASIAMHALGRIGNPREVASLIEWLVSSDASWVTGQIFGIDGGLASVRPRPKAAAAR
ncbi:MAG: SDR family oxidoreductase [Planctomycetota bacterium]|nr:SDR family oxidoreductase [Planctomycetota bacterium]